MTAVFKREEVSSRGRIACFLPDLRDGGAQLSTVRLLEGLVKLDLKVDLIVADASGPYLRRVPRAVRLINLKAGRSLKAIVPLSNYLRRERPFALLSQMNYANLVALQAKKLSGADIKLVLVEQTTLSALKTRLWRDKLIPLLVKRLYRRADALVGVSQGVAHDLENQLGLAPGTVSVIYNAVVSDDVIAKAKAPLNHPWLAGPDPVFLAAGRLTPQKDFFTLIRAFAYLRKRREARLVILGEGESRRRLEELAVRLGVNADISMPGFVDNPFAYMSRASAFVLSSRREGLPSVLIEAMACGCPVVAADCPSGPNEILELGKYGSLVPVGDAVSMSQAMWQAIESPADRNLLIQRAMDFSIDRAAHEYHKLIRALPAAC